MRNNPYYPQFSIQYIKSLFSHYTEIKFRKRSGWMPSFKKYEWYVHIRDGHRVHELKGCADPYIFTYNGITIVLVERINSGKGSIECYRLDKDLSFLWSIEKLGSISFPQVHLINGRYILLCESVGCNESYIYEFNLYDPLMLKVLKTPIGDFMLFKHKDANYLYTVCTEFPGLLPNVPRIYKLTDDYDLIEVDFQIESEYGDFRPGSVLFDQKYFFVQICGFMSYGRDLTLKQFHVSELNNKLYLKIENVASDFKMFKDIHTYSKQKEVIVFDKKRFNKKDIRL